MAKIKKLAWKYRIQSLKIAKMKHFYTFFISEIGIVASSCLKISEKCGNSCCNNAFTYLVSSEGYFIDKN